MIQGAAYVRVNEETLIFKHSGRELHHLSENKQISEVVSDLFGDELHEVRHELVEAWIAPYAG